jgi:2-polyprenyl-6-methoxyphenol hydroxylase-like FAD-dependent oxidoreductase
VVRCLSRLRRHGFSPTAVERAPAPRTGGQAIDVRGAALAVMDRTGPLAEVRAAGTAMARHVSRRFDLVIGDGRELARPTDLN